MTAPEFRKDTKQAKVDHPSHPAPKTDPYNIYATADTETTQPFGALENPLMQASEYESLAPYTGDMYPAAPTMVDAAMGKSGPGSTPRGGGTPSRRKRRTY